MKLADSQVLGKYVVVRVEKPTYQTYHYFGHFGGNIYHATKCTVFCMLPVASSTKITVMTWYDTVSSVMVCGFSLKWY